MEKILTCKEDCLRVSDFTKWLLSVLGPVLLGSKPAEILSFNKNSHTYLKELEDMHYCATTCKHLSIRKVESANDTVKILFYFEDKLNSHISNKSSLKFLRSMGYPEDYDLNSYLDYLMERLSSDEFPHEIGLFLGYPLKDIMGFMGHPSLKLTKVKNWRVYGDPRVSDEKMVDFEKAKKEMCLMLKFHTPDNILKAI